MMGIARVNLAAKSVDFYTLGPATGVSFAMAPDRKVAYGLFEDIGRYEFWKFDLEHRKFAGRTEFKGRPRMGLKTSSNGKVLYIYVAGNTIDLYDAETLSVPAHDHARRRHDDGVVRVPGRRRRRSPTAHGRPMTRLCRNRRGPGDARTPTTLASTRRDGS